MGEIREDTLGWEGKVDGISRDGADRTDLLLELVLQVSTAVEPRRARSAASVQSERTPGVSLTLSFSV